MAKRRQRTKRDDLGGYVWRGGKRIELEHDADRFTVMPSTPDQIRRLTRAPGVTDIQSVTNQVFRVRAAPGDRDLVMASLRSEEFAVVAHHAYRPRHTEGTVFYITDRIIVQFSPRTSTGVVDRLLDQYGLRVLREYDAEPGVVLVQVTAGSGSNPIKVANRLVKERGILLAEPNMVNRFRPAFVPDDPSFRRQWHLSSHDAPQLQARASVNAPEAWDVTRGDRSIVLAIIDDGFDLNHPDFTGVKKVVFPKDYVDGDANPFPERDVQDFHGTPCAGVAIAEMNGRGVVGIAAGCAFMPVRIPLAADDDLLIDIFEEAGRHADAISCSWGPPPVYAPLATAVARTLARLSRIGGPRGRGVVICVAAGNFDAPISDPVNKNGITWLDYGTGEKRKTTGPITNGMAAHPDVVAVAASTSMNKHAFYSNWGPEISVSAPSNNFHPLEPGTYAPGRGIWTTDNEAYGEGFAAHSRYTGKFGGTSSATPLTAGVAALILSANPELSGAEVRQILRATADKIVDPGKDPILGVNRGRYDAKGRCDWFGSGKVNAAKAVAEAARRRKQ